MVTSRASAGGAGDAVGGGLQDRVFAWAATAMAVEAPLLDPGLVAGKVVQVGAQTGFHVDDVAARTDLGGFALFQAKAGMSLGKTETSDLGKALDQLVDQYLSGRLPVEDGTDRTFDPARDVLVICTDSSAAATVRDALPAAIARTASQPPGTVFGHELTKPQDIALSVILAHVRRLWAAKGKGEPPHEQIRDFLRAMRVITLALQDGEPAHAAAISHLSRVLPTGTDLTSAWNVLVGEGHAAAEKRQWRDRSALQRALSHARIFLDPPTRFAADIARLRDISTSNLEVLASDSLLPISGGIHIRRDVSDTVVAHAGEHNLLIVGDAGAGKSAVVASFASDRRSRQEVVVLRAVDMVGLNRLSLDAPLGTIFREWTGAPALLVIDGVDALRGADDREVLTSIVRTVAGTRWQIVATVRTFDARHNQQIRQAFAGAPLSPQSDQRDPQLVDVRHIVVGDFTDGELRTAMTPPLDTLWQEASQHLQNLLRNPFNLRIAIRVTDHSSSSGRARLLGVRSRVGLLDAYWTHRVHSDDVTARDAVLARLCRAMVSTRRLRVLEAEPVITGTDSGAVTAMLSENVLAIEPSLPQGRRVLAFSHNILFDYAAAIYVLFDPIDPARLLHLLDEDPVLPLTARPSVEILVEMLWYQGDSDLFWSLCLKIVESEHTLASLAFAARLVSMVDDSSALKPLWPAVGRADRPSGMWPEQQLTRHLIGALRTPSLLPQPEPAVAVLSTLAHRFAVNTANSRIDGALAIELLKSLEFRVPLRSNNAGSVDRAEAVATLLDGCRTHPVQLEDLAEVAANHLQHAVGVSPAVSAAIERLLDDDGALAQWGGSVLSGLALAVVQLMSVEPDLAYRTVSTILTFNETRDENVPLSHSVMVPMHESRRQQAGHSIYTLGQAFGALCSTSLYTASKIFCDISEQPPTTGSSSAWPLSFGDVQGWLGFGSYPATTRHRIGELAAHALGTALTQRAELDADVLSVLVGRLHNAMAWDALIAASDNASALGVALLPALDSGALLAHPVTHAATSHILAALSAADPAMADRLEDIVLRAYDLIDANGGSDHTKDVLVGCLSRDLITSPVLQARLAAIGPISPPPIPGRLEPIVTSRIVTVFDRLSEQNIPVEPTVEAVGQALWEELGIVQGGNDTRPDPERKLPILFEEADILFATCSPLPAELSKLLVDAAAALSRDNRVSPDTRLGGRIFDILRESVQSPDTGNFIE